MTASTLLNAMIAWYLEELPASHDDRDQDHRYAGRWEMLLHAATVTWGVSEGEATERLAEELADRFAAMAD
jgi:hypothetical protein